MSLRDPRARAAFTSFTDFTNFTNGVILGPVGRSIAEKVTEPKETRRTKKVPVVAARSEAIIDELRGGLGESSFLSVLNIVLQEIRPTLRMQQSEDQDASRLPAANAARVASTRAAILAQSVNSDAAGAFISR